MVLGIAIASISLVVGVAGVVGFRPADRWVAWLLVVPVVLVASGYGAVRGSRRARALLIVVGIGGAILGLVPILTELTLEVAPVAIEGGTESPLRPVYDAIDLVPGLGAIYQSDLLLLPILSLISGVCIAVGAWRLWGPEEPANDPQGTARP